MFLYLFVITKNIERFPIFLIFFANLYFFHSNLLSYCLISWYHTSTYICVHNIYVKVNIYTKQNKKKENTGKRKHKKRKLSFTSRRKTSIRKSKDKRYPQHIHCYESFVIIHPITSDIIDNISVCVCVWVRIRYYF